MKYYSDLKVTSGLLILALAIGGSGLSFPLLQMLLGIFAIGVAACFVVTPQPAPSVLFARPIVTLLWLMLLLAILQLIPLPPALWRQLPGRELPAKLDDIIGWTVWRPWTLDVEATIRAFLTVIPAAVVLLGCLRLPTAKRIRLLWIVLAFALIDAALGIVQFASGGKFTPFPSAHSGYPIGLFVNRNHNAVLLLSSMPIAAALGAAEIARGRSRVPVITVVLSIMAILAIVVLGTTSRMAFVLLPFVIVGSFMLLFTGQSILRIVVPSIVPLAVLAIILLVGGGLSRDLIRFSSLSDARFDYWTDVYWALGHYGLAGTGFGTFIPVFQTAESLGTVAPAILNHAHNDYIEILLEGGVPAVLLLLVAMAFFVFAAIRKMGTRESADRKILFAAAGIAIGVVLLFSLVDYPLRMPALSCVFALLCTFMLPSARYSAKGMDQSLVDSGRKRDPARGRQRSLVSKAAGLAALGVLLVLILQAGISARAINEGRSDYAARFAPWSTEAHAQTASAALFTDNDKTIAHDQALAALRLSPISAPAIRTLGLMSGLAHNRARSAGLMEVAATLGWRDPITQLWAIDAARQSREPAKAVERAEALFQQGLFPPAAIISLLEPPLGAAAAKRLIGDLARRPQWRSGLLGSATQYPDKYLPGFEWLVLQLNRTRQPTTMDEAQPLLDRLSAMGKSDEAQRLWASVHARGLILNGGFEQTNAGRGVELPTDWDVSTEDIPSLAIDRPPFGGTGRALRNSQSRGSAPLVAQKLMLGPGTYVLSYRVHAKSGSGVIIRWEMRCLETGANFVNDVSPVGGIGWERFTARFTVPNQNCRNQRLAFERLGDIHPQEIWIDDVALSPQSIN